MTPIHPDDEIRDRLAPLARHEPTPLEVAEVLRRRRAGGVRARGHRRRVLRLGVLGLAAAAGLLAALLAPGDPRPAEPSRLGQNVLLAAADVAEKRGSPDGPLRYTRVDHTLTDEVRRAGRVAFRMHRHVAEAWVGARWRGREIGTAERVTVSGDPELTREVRAAPRGGAPAYDRAFAYGDGPLARLDPRDLPEDRETLARVLYEGMRNDRWGPYAKSRGRPMDIPEDVMRAHNAYRTITLLIYARLSGPQRAALLDVLAADAHARDLGTVTDGTGRRGLGVRLSYPVEDPGGRTIREEHRLIFDPVTAEVLEWTMARGDGADLGSPHRRAIVLETGWAQKVRQRP
jgi:hypothetical protein